MVLGAHWDIHYLMKHLKGLGMAFNFHTVELVELFHPFPVIKQHNIDIMCHYITFHFLHLSINIQRQSQNSDLYYESVHHNNIYSPNAFSLDQTCV